MELSTGIKFAGKAVMPFDGILKITKNIAANSFGFTSPATENSNLLPRIEEAVKNGSPDLSRVR